MTAFSKKQWETYCNEHLAIVTPLLMNEGFMLETDQPHIIGERYVLSGPKLVLYGARRSDDLRVVIKITNDTKEARDLELERTAQEVLHTMNFAYHTFLSPTEILFGQHGTYTFHITEYIPQEKTFLEHSITEQLFIALKAFEVQEGSRATTHEHLQTIYKNFEVFDVKKYIQSLTHYRDALAILLPQNSTVQNIFDQSLTEFEAGATLLETYSNFLTHWDFVPRNIRIHNRDIYLLDHSAIRFGNKYEGWARFMNFMTLYNRTLEQALDTYVRQNRSTGEYETLRLMRLYRLSELVWFYATKREFAEGTLLTLTDARIDLWSRALEAQLNHTALDEETLEVFKNTRDSLRDEDEKKRQQTLH